MKHNFKYIGSMLTAVFLLLLIYPANAADNIEQVRQQANQYIADYYQMPSFFEPSATINSKPADFKAEFDYDISEIKWVKFKKEYTDMPAVYYESADRGEYENGIYQFLGQTKEGETVTDVRFPLKSSWGEKVYMEDLDWVADPWDNRTVRNWWEGYSGSEIIVSEFDRRLRQNPDLATNIDARIMVSNVVQIRQENGKELPISDFWDVARSNPKCYNYPWHKYVHVTIPPTETTWGYGVGFVNRDGRIGYKSFPIAPLGLKLAIPDFYPTAEKTTYTGQPGEIVDVNVSLWNQGEYDVTNFAWTKYGGGWGSPTWLDEEVGLGKWGKKDYTAPIVVTDTAQKYVFAANVYGDKPQNEMNKTNNSITITVMPDSVDLAASIAPVQKQYAVHEFPYTVPTNAFVDRKDSGAQEVPAIITVSLSNGQKKVYEKTFEKGGEWGDGVLWSIKKAGTYTARIEVQPIGFTDVNPKNNVATCTFTVVERKSTPPPTDSGDEDIRAGLGSM